MSVQVMMQQLFSGMLITIQIFIFTLLFSLPLGLLIAFGRMSKNMLLRGIAKIYISIMRGTPLMLQLLVVYFGPYYIFRVNIPSSYRAYAVIIAFAINYAAYFAEIFRGGLMAIDKGQNEAAKVLGLNKIQTFIYVIIPQMIRVSLPALSNESITLVKDTSLLTVISIAEISYVAKTAVTRDASVFPLVIAGAMYLLLILILTIILRLIEKKFSYASKSL